jgi:hypothetical protein
MATPYLTSGGSEFMTLAASGPGEWDIRAKRLRQGCRIDSNLRHIAVRFGAGEKFAVTLVYEDVKDGLIERRIRGMPVRFPVPIDQIDFNAAAPGLPAIRANGGVFEIRAGFAVPDSELNDIDLVATGADKAVPELAGKPASLEFEFVRRPQGKE